VRELRKRWQLNQKQAAKVFGGGPVAFSKYESDDVMQSDSMDKLLRMAADVPGVLNKLAADAGVVLMAESSWENLFDVVAGDFGASGRKIRLLESHAIEGEVAYG